MMSVTLKQINGGLVAPTDDARLYELLSGGAVGIVTGCEVTHLGANQLQIAAGWGICLGRCFAVEQETINAAVSASGTVAGRLMLRIDTLGDVSAELVTEAQAVLADPVQEAINYSGSVYELPLAEYQVSEVLISDLVDIAPRVYTPGHAHACTLTAAGWEGDAAPYSQTVAVDGMTADWVPGIPSIVADASMETNQAMRAALACVSQITSAENALTFICYESVPESDMTIRVPGVMV